MIGKMNEAMRMDEIAKETSGENERLGCWGSGWDREREREWETEMIEGNCFHEFSALFPQQANLLITQYIYLKSVSYP